MELNFHSPHSTIKILGREKYWVFTENNGRMLDTLMGNTAFVFGYDNKEIVSAMRDMQDRIPFLNWRSTEVCDENDQLVERICERGKYKSLGWAVSGSDGVEAAVRINELYWQQVDPKKRKIVSFTPGYHGTTYLARLLRDKTSSDIAIVLDAPLWTHIANRRFAEANSYAQLKQKLESSNDIGAVIFESLPWASGIMPWSDSWWHNVRNLCNKYNINLILDDVMGCCGKMGYYFSQDRIGPQADLVVMGKALTGGFGPLSAVCVNSRITDIVKKVYDYGHTWQPNMAGVGAATAVLDIFDQFDFHAIEQRLDTLGKKIVSMGLAYESVVQGLVFELRLDNPIKASTYTKHGLVGSFNEAETFAGIDVFVPAIADDEYFYELETRLISCLIDKT